MADCMEWTWVYVDVIRASQSFGYRGRMAVTDFEAITTGGFTLPFVALEDAHWTETVWNEHAERREFKVTALGQTPPWVHAAGALYLRPEAIATIVPLRVGYEQDYRNGELRLGSSLGGLGEALGARPRPAREG